MHCSIIPPIYVQISQAACRLKLCIISHFRPTILFDLITLRAIDKQHRLWNYALCNTLNTTVAWSSLLPTALLSTDWLIHWPSTSACDDYFNLPSVHCSVRSYLAMLTTYLLSQNPQFHHCNHWTSPFNLIQFHPVQKFTIDFSQVYFNICLTYVSICQPVFFHDVF